MVRFFISERGIMYVMYDISIQASGSFHLHPHKINCTLHTGFEQSRCFEGSCRSRERKIYNDQIIPRQLKQEKGGILNGKRLFPF